ncbi:MAG TPA: HDOD domain-containing protein [Fibrobacteria bacterium]|nr:HDOD domain-containing protein [Fibrobacteria bacterium]
MTKTILVVDDQQMFRDSIVDVLKLRGYTVMDADSVPLALAAVAKSVPDLALVDICMPDYDGIEFLRMINVRSDRTKIPVILMTAQPKREYLEEAAKLGVRDFVVKSSFSVQELVLRIEMRLAPEESAQASPAPAAPLVAGAANDSASLAPSRARSTALSSASTIAAASAGVPSGAPSVGASAAGSSIGPISTMGPLSGYDPQEALAHKRKKIASRVRLFRNIEARALPGPVTEILELASSMTASLVQLETVVRRDPVLSARVLSLANSAAHRGATLVGQLDEALRNVGIDSVVEMISMIPLVERDALQGKHGRDLAGIWWHCLATAVLCDRLAPGHVRSGAYLAGLFHDLPLLFGLQALGEEWNECRQKAIDEGTAPSEAVSEAFGMVPGQLAQEVYARYRIPESIAGPLRDYHNICLGRQPREPGELPRRVDAAHNLAVALGWGWNDLAEVRPLSQDEGRSWRDFERLALELPQIEDEIAKLGALAGLPEPDRGVNEERDLWGEVGIAYWRDPRWRSPDPVEHVLSRAKRFDAYDSPESLLKIQGVRKVAAVEPESGNWKTIMASPDPILVLHKASLGNLASPPGFRFLRLPVPVCLLRETINLM